MKVFKLILSSLAFALLSSCTMAQKGASAADDYCDCKSAGDFLDVAKCYKDVLKENKEALKDSAFRNAFWEKASECK